MHSLHYSYKFSHGWKLIPTKNTCYAVRWYKCCIAYYTVYLQSRIVFSNFLNGKLRLYCKREHIITCLEACIGLQAFLPVCVQVHTCKGPHPLWTVTAIDKVPTVTIALFDFWEHRIELVLLNDIRNCACKYALAICNVQ